MPWTINYIFVLIGTFLIAIVATPLVRSLALRVGAVDNPNARRINKKPMPSAGGLAILLAFVLATLVFMPMIIHRISGMFLTLGISCRLLWEDLSWL